MKTHKKNNHTHTSKIYHKKQSRSIQRQRQVRRQKIFLGLSLLLIIILLLSFLVLRPLRRERSAYTINSTCESYRSDVEEAAAAYDMTDYVNLILALMMQESSGQGTDVLQSSEGAYNTKYPQTPNGITSWSVESSETFAEMASGETARSQDDPMYTTAGPWDYGDQYYPEHVLRYYHP